MLKETVEETSALPLLDDKHKKAIEYWIDNVHKLSSLSPELKERIRNEFILARETGTVSRQLLTDLSFVGNESPPVSEKKIKKTYTLDLNNFSDAEKGIMSLLQRNLPEKLRIELESNYKDAKDNDFKFRLADIAIIMDLDECLKVILQSLKKDITKARSHFSHLNELADVEQAHRCTLVLNDYNYLSSTSILSHQLKFMFNGNAKNRWEKENLFKAAIIEQSDDEAGLSAAKSHSNG